MTEHELHRWLCWGVITVAAAVFVALFWIAAPYGRHSRGGWGPTISTRWAWVVMESPASLGFAVVFALGAQRFAMVPLLLASLWMLHYGYRTFIYPLRIRATGKRTPITVVAMGFAFNVVNAYINARVISELGDYPASWLADPRLIAGVALFLIGRQINHRSDAILIGLRDSTTDYAIPRGGLFRWVSCPNYLGEVMEWTGWAIATWSLGGAAFAIYTFANLAPRALAHHRWYHQKFAGYPNERRAIIPFLF